MDGKTRSLVAASVAGLLAALGASLGSQAQAGPHDSSEDGSGACYGVNKCQGTGDCGGKGRSCAGSNACKGQGYIKMDKADCVRLEGGRLTEEPQAS